MKNTISELKNTVEGIKSKLDEAEDGIRDPSTRLVGSEMCIRDRNKSKRKTPKPCTHGRTSSNTTFQHLHNGKQEVGDILTLR